MQELLEEKNGICISESTDFGRIELGKSRNIELSIRCVYSFKNLVDLFLLTTCNIV